MYSASGFVLLFLNPRLAIGTPLEEAWGYIRNNLKIAGEFDLLDESLGVQRNNVLATGKNEINVNNKILAPGFSRGYTKEP